MITRFGSAPRMRGTGAWEFIDHWKTSHADAAGQIPGLRRYHQNHPIKIHGRRPFGYVGFDAGSELDFDSVEAMRAGFASEVYQTAVRADEEAFVDKSRFSLVVAAKENLADGPEEGVKLLSFLTVHPSSDLDALLSAVRGPYAAETGAASRHDLFVAIPGGSDPLPQACDAVDILWFPDEVAMGEFLDSEAWDRATWELTGRAFGIARVAARPFPVV